MKLRVGSGLPNIQKKALNDFVILIPPLNEQIKISNFLTAIDEKIADCQTQKKRWKPTKKDFCKRCLCK